MSKRGYISRYLMVLRRLKAKPYSTYEELKGYMKNQYGYLQMQDDTLDFMMSIRTFQRDIKEIRNLFGIDIEYSKARKGYHIIQTESENLNFQRMLEAFDMFNSLNLAHDLTQYVHLESRRPQGTENLYGFLHAIKNRLRARFTYQKFWEEAVSKRAVEPYAMKEFKNRWYVIAKDSKDGYIKSFALDRLSELEITSFTFAYPGDFNIEEMYRNFFGIISPFGEVPQEIVLSFEPFQGKYIKTLPLHHTQKIIINNDEELRVSLNLCVTYDFMMELLSFGDSLKVLQPESLSVDVKLAHEKAFRQY